MKKKLPTAILILTSLLLLVSIAYNIYQYYTIKNMHYTMISFGKEGVHYRTKIRELNERLDSLKNVLSEQSH